MTKDPLDRFRRAAKALKASYEAGVPDGLTRMRANPPRRDGAELKHADFLHVIARENQFNSWPMMKEAIARLGMDRAARQQRLKVALWHGQTQIIRDLVWEDPNVTDGALGLQCALYEPRFLEALAEDPTIPATEFGGRRPLLHLTFSKAFEAFPDRSPQMFEIAQALLNAGADVNDSFPAPGDEENPLSALYGAIGHAGNLELGQWLLDRGANPNDGESLYHACEIGSPEGVGMLLAAGADPNQTNALKRAMDFDSLEMVQLFLDAGADPNEGADGWTALHHAALRMSSGPICNALVDAGADASITGRGITAYAAAKVYGNEALAQLMTPVALSKDEQLLAKAAVGEVPEGRFVDPAKLPDIYLDLVREFAGRPEKQTHLSALIKIGMPWDRPDQWGVTPVQIAGWLGQPEMLSFFLQLKPNLGHVNGYGGTLFSTILHGSDNNPERSNGDYVTCLRIVLEEGVSLPRRAIKAAGNTDIRAFLSEWAEQKPGQVVEHGVV